MPLVYLGSFLSAIVISFVLTRYVRDAALRNGWISAPTAARHVHQSPTPRIGGVAIYLTTALVAVSLILSSRYIGLDLGFSPRIVLSIAIPATAIFLLGFYDDIFGASPAFKFAVQIAAATFLYIAGLRVYRLPLLFGLHGFTWIIALPMTILWVVWITNAFNLLDGIDGLSAGSALFSTLTVFVVSLVATSPLVSLLSVVLAGAILGFLRFNFNPATIFLGDSGSLFIGFLLSALAIAGTQKGPLAVAIGIPIVAFGLPILETALSVVRRFLSGRPLFDGDRDHIHHKLLAHGLSQRQAVAILYGVSALLALLSLFLLNFGGTAIGIVLFVIGMGAWVGIQRLRYLEFRELRGVAQRTLAQRQTIVNNLVVRRMGEKLAHVRTAEELSALLIGAFSGNDFSGFDLIVRPARATENPALPFARDSEGQYRYSWRKPDMPGSPGNEDEAAGWSLRMNLPAAEHYGNSELWLHRAKRQGPLQVDLDLLTSDFHSALALALNRIMSPQPLPAALPLVRAAAASSSGVSQPG